MDRLPSRRLGGRRRAEAERRRHATRAASGLLLATDVADYLVAKGLPFRDAHEVVGALVRRLLDERTRLRRAQPGRSGAQHSPLFGEDVRQAVTPLASVEKKQTPQSTAPKAVAAALLTETGCEARLGCLHELERQRPI